MNKYISAFDAICDSPQQAANLRLRAELMRHISETVSKRNWTEKQAAEYCGITQTDMADLLNGKIDAFPLDILVDIHTQLGEEITLQFQPA
jgi:XRE family transcriptional regulator